MLLFICCLSVFSDSEYNRMMFYKRNDKEASSGRQPTDNVHNINTEPGAGNIRVKENFFSVSQSSLL